MVGPSDEATGAATNPAGNYLSPDCVSWTNGASFNSAVVGDYTFTTPEWTAQGQQSPCGVQAHIYCIEQ